MEEYLLKQKKFYSIVRVIIIIYQPTITEKRKKNSIKKIFNLNKKYIFL